MLPWTVDRHVNLEKEYEDLKLRFNEESKEKKDLYNKVIELKGNIRVFCRCRPLNMEEKTGGASMVVDFESAKDGKEFGDMMRPLADNNSNRPLLQSPNDHIIFKNFLQFRDKENKPEIAEEPLPRKASRVSLCPTIRGGLPVTPAPRRNSLIPLPMAKALISTMDNLSPPLPSQARAIHTTVAACEGETRSQQRSAKKINSILRRSLQKKVIIRPQLPQAIRRGGTLSGLDKLRLSVGRSGRKARRMFPGNAGDGDRVMQQKQKKEKERGWNHGATTALIYHYATAPSSNGRVAVKPQVYINRFDVRPYSPSKGKPERRRTGLARCRSNGGFTSPVVILCFVKVPFLTNSRCSFSLFVRVCERGIRSLDLWRDASVSRPGCASEEGCGVSETERTPSSFDSLVRFLFQARFVSIPRVREPLFLFAALIASESLCLSLPEKDPKRASCFPGLCGAPLLRLRVGANMSDLQVDSDGESGQVVLNSSQSSMSSSGGSCEDRRSSFCRFSFDDAAPAVGIELPSAPSRLSSKPHRSSDPAWAAIWSRAVDANLGPRDFKLVRRIGSGDIGTVYLCRLRDEASQCAYVMKVVDKLALKKKKKLERAATEKRILRVLDHPFLPTLYADFDASPHYSCVVMEYCSGGDLHTLRHRQPRLRFSVAATRSSIDLLFLN
ncbi:hypothetical protein BHE74_00014761 [Ensete ventricosum]|nr:hypothetical protein BHE74_00014761 [Ensete ventricosum]